MNSFSSCVSHFNSIVFFLMLISVFESIAGNLSHDRFLNSPPLPVEGTGRTVRACGSKPTKGALPKQTSTTVREPEWLLVATNSAWRLGSASREFANVCPCC